MTPLGSVARWAPVTLGGLLVVAGIGWLDLATGPELGMSLFYLLPIVATAKWVGAWPAFVVAVAAGLAWFGADMAHYGRQHLALSLWNGGTRLAIYVAMGQLVARVQADRRRLRAQLERESELSRTDHLTGLANVRGLGDAISRELARARRVGRPVCLAYIDLDNFKQVNDRHGHAAGSEMLRDVAAAILATVRAADVAARLGGDEFGVLFADLEEEEASQVAARILERIREVGGRYPDARVGASVGIAFFVEAPANADVLLGEADRAMYLAKHGGKDRVVKSVIKPGAAHDVMVA